MPYPGGKAGAGVYQRIINQIPPHDVYIEPFLGDGAVCRRKLPALRNVGVEIDAEVAKAFAAGLRGGGPEGPAGELSGADVELYNCCGIEWLKHAFQLYRIPTLNPAAPPAATHHSTPRSDAASSGGSRSLRAAAAAGSNGVGRPHHQPLLSASGSDAAESAGPSSFIYCDPPYLLSTRRSKRRLYRHEMTEAQHVDLLEVLCRIDQAGRAFIAISGYPSPLYAATLQKWRCIRFRANTRGGRAATECLWMNYPPPAELHDYRYLGGEKRDRERIARKVRTWSAGLLRLPLLERQAILRALAIDRR